MEREPTHRFSPVNRYVKDIQVVACIRLLPFHRATICESKHLQKFSLPREHKIARRVKFKDCYIQVAVRLPKVLELVDMQRGRTSALEDYEIKLAVCNDLSGLLLASEETRESVFVPVMKSST